MPTVDQKKFEQLIDIYSNWNNFTNSLENINAASLASDIYPNSVGAMKKWKELLTEIAKPFGETE
jgi:hypothetical protein